MSKVPIAREAQGFSLAELIESTADELRAAGRRNEERDAVMQFKACELELAVTVKGEAGGGIRFWVVDASAKVTGETVSKIKLSFGPGINPSCSGRPQTEIDPE